MFGVPSSYVKFGSAQLPVTRRVHGSRLSHRDAMADTDLVALTPISSIRVLSTAFKLTRLVVAFHSVWAPPLTHLDYIVFIS